MINFLYLSVICIVLIIFKIFWKLTTKWDRSYTCLVGKTAIVTGANSGVGYMTALEFAKRGACVILACRNESRAKEARRKIIEATGNQHVVYRLLDMESFESVRNFAKDINESQERLDILVNNAGIMLPEKNCTSDELDTILQTNHFSTFLLTHLLIDKLKKSAPSRIINVASLMARFSILNADNTNNIGEVSKGGSGIWKLLQNIDSYSKSKLCNILFTTELARKLDGTGVTVNALHPGIVFTQLVRNSRLKIIWNILGLAFFSTPEEGAQTQIYLSISKDLEGVSGGLFSNCTNVGVYRNAKDPGFARKVWEISEEICKLNPNEKI